MKKQNDLILELVEYKKYDNDKELFQETIKKIKPFRKIDGDVPLELLEMFIHKMSKKYLFRPQWINFSLGDDKYYSLSFVETEKHDWIGTVYGATIYELFLKSVLKIFNDIKNNKIKKVD